MSYPISQHILFVENREAFARSFHRLAEKLTEHNIDVTLLDEVVDAVQEVEGMKADAAFELGYKKGWLNGKSHIRYQIFREDLKKEVLAQ
ncbi:hypothetical protein [Alteribacillus sp. HJP-4]|uniref:hypothetical protein n=1 Tax=Alteribacillus sp. HJP-4 TaxID=2775394 RepID=UPI0035CD1940